MRKNSYGKILKEKPKKQYLSTVLMSCSIIIIIDTFTILIFELYYLCYKLLFQEDSIKTEIYAQN